MMSSELVGTDDVLTFLGGAPVLLQTGLDSADLFNCASWPQLGGSSKDGCTMSVLILENGQIAALQQNFLAEEGQFVLPDVVEETESFVDGSGESPLVTDSSLSYIALPDQVSPSEESVKDGGKMKHEEESNTDASCMLNDLADALMEYKCRNCPFLTDSKRHLVEHFRTVHISRDVMESVLSRAEENPIDDQDQVTKRARPEGAERMGADSPVERVVYLCSICSTAHLSLEECKEHMQKDHMLLMDGGEVVQEELASETVSNDEQRPMEVAQAKTRMKRNKKIHAIKADPEFVSRPFKCARAGCPNKFRSQESLDIHSSCHPSPPSSAAQFVCPQCAAQFAKWHACAAHLWKQHALPVDLHTCTLCNTYKATTQIKLANHMLIHRDTRDYTCPECNKSFKQKAQLNNHQWTHTKKESAVETPRWYNSQQCEICHKTLADTKVLKKHIQTVHSKLRPYVCNVCGHSSARKAMMQTHLRQHTGEKPYACSECPFKTGDHNSLRRHMMRHSGKRPYPCPHCPYSAIQSSSIKTHLAAKHPGLAGTHCCAHCPYKTISPTQYALHLSDHKNNLIETFPPDVEEVFPENVVAAQLVYQCLGAYPSDASQLQTDVTSSSTSADGTKQTITIAIAQSRDVTTTDDEDTANCYLQSGDIDTGGITIPADPTPF